MIADFFSIFDPDWWMDENKNSRCYSILNYGTPSTVFIHLRIILTG